MKFDEIELIEKVQETPDSYSFKFTKPDDYDFKAGQHALWQLDGYGLEGDESKRIFTIASHPDEDFLMFTTRIAEKHSDFKEVLLNKLEKGDSMKIAPPLGKFGYGDDEKKSLVIIGGIGITPIRPLLMEFKKSGQDDHEMKIYYSDNRGTYCYTEELKSLAGEMDNVDLVFFDDQDKFTEAVKDYAKEEGNDAEYIMAGSPGMNNAFTETLTGLGVDEDRLVTDNFKGYE